MKNEEFWPGLGWWERWNAPFHWQKLEWYFRKGWVGLGGFDPWKFFRFWNKPWIKPMKQNHAMFCWPWSWSACVPLVLVRYDGKMMVQCRWNGPYIDREWYCSARGVKVGRMMTCYSYGSRLADFIVSGQVMVNVVIICDNYIPTCKGKWQVS